MKSEDIYKESDEYLDGLYVEYLHYIWEEQDYQENKYMYEYDLEHLKELRKREKM